MRHKNRPPVGARPGTLMVSGKAKTSEITCFSYDEAAVEERSVARPSDLVKVLAGPGKKWIDVQGVGSEETLREIGETFGVHPLALEDVAHIPQRPKTEHYEKQRLYITHMVSISRGGDRIETEQLSIFFSHDWVLTIQERPGDVFEPIRQRLREGLGPMRKSGPDYLAYAIIDAVVDAYYPALDHLGDRLEALESQVVAAPRPTQLSAINDAKRQILAFRRLVWPQREAINELLREDASFISKRVRVYLRDVYDHCIQIMDVVESQREIASGLVNTYLSCLGNRTNDVMKVLTIMASIFIPLTFLAGIYGMNFENIPELHFRWGYPALLGVMVAVTIGMIFFFRRLGWLGPPKKPEKEKTPGPPRPPAP